MADIDDGRSMVPEKLGPKAPHPHGIDFMEVLELGRAENLAQLSCAVRLTDLALKPLLCCPSLSLEVSSEDTDQSMPGCLYDVQRSTPLWTDGIILGFL